MACCAAFEESGGRYHAGSCAGANPNLSAKASNLVQSGGIVEVPDARTFETKNGYTVTLHAPVGSRMDTCTCRAGQARTRCYHVAAARLLVAQSEGTS
jgi:hypothetical protein